MTYVTPATGVAGEGEDRQPMNDDELARRLADEAGAELVALRERRGFGDPKALRDEADAMSHRLLMKRLAETRPADAVLSEEGHDDQTRLASDRVWIVDPLDGTREYGEAGRTDWAVHVALWQRGQLVAGAVALPAQGVTLATDDPAAAAAEAARRPDPAGGQPQPGHRDGDGGGPAPRRRAGADGLGRREGGRGHPR